jgi:hypothetical protein
MRNPTSIRSAVPSRIPALLFCLFQGACNGGSSGGDGADSDSEDGADTDTDTDPDTDTETDAGDTIWKVRADADPGGDGLSWATAFDNPQGALALATAGDEIWVAAGTYTPTAGDDRAVSFVLVQGVGLYGGFDGTEEERDERDWGANPTVLSGAIGVPGDGSDNSYHVVLGADDAVLDGFTITGGRADGDHPHQGGGGMLNENASPTVANCVFLDNAASRWGGGIYDMLSQTIVRDCVFIGNSADEGGGLMNVHGFTEAIGCVFAGNSATCGGGVMSYGYLHWYAGSGESRSGCGLAELLAENCVFAGNSASYGGALGNDCSWVSITNSTISGNSAGEAGGGVDTNYQTVIANTIIWGNTAQGQGDSIFGGYYDLQFTRSCIEEEGWDWAWEWEDEIIYLDPLFVDSGNPAGPDGIWMTADDGLRLSGGSPCIDAADGDLAPGFDILGNPRFDHPSAGNTGSGEPPFVDIGTYEFAAWTDEWKVRADAGPGGDGLTWATAFDSPQQALASAMAGEEIWVAAGAYTPTAGDDRAVSFALKQGVGLYGGFDGTEEQRDQRDPAANMTVLSGDIGVPGDDSDNSYHVVLGANDAVLDGFTVTGGRADGDGLRSLGGGMLSVLASPVVNDCVFERNAAVRGGGMLVGGGMARVTGCAFVENAAVRGGGMLVGGGHLVTGSVFAGNVAVYGGGIYSYQSSPGIANCVFTGNAADGGGGMLSHGQSPRIESSVFQGNEARFGAGMHNQDASPLIIDCTIVGNEASRYGGGVSSSNSSPQVTNTLIWRNTAGHSGLSIYDNAADTAVRYSCVENGWPGEGNIDEEPLFVDSGNPAGPDGIWMTADDGLRLPGGSPCIDAADGDLAPGFDILGNPRVDCPETENTGIGAPPFADIGAYEHQP